jgi:ATP-dependent helicase/nuclease subunit B
MNTALAGKLHDLHLILSQAEARYAALGLLDGEDLLDRLADQVRDFPDFSGAHIWLDGFTGFTPQEYRVLARIISVASQVTLTLTMPPESLNLTLREEDPFFTPWETAQHLMSELSAMAESVVIEKQEHVHRFAPDSALGYVEAHYHKTLFCPLQGAAVDNVSLVGAANRRAEVEAATREIIRLCRDQGYRYRDLCVIVRDFAVYEDLIPVVFRDHAVPFFMDRKRLVPHHPLLDLLRAAIDCVRSDWAYDPVMRCLKTDLFPLESHDVDCLDNFVLGRGIRGRRWFSEDSWPVAQPGDDMPAISRGRSAVAKFMQPLAETFANGTPGEMVGALIRLMEDLGVEEKMDIWRAEAQAAGDLETAGLHPQVFRSIRGLLRELADTLGSEHMDMETFALTLATGLEGISLGLVPAGLDQVLVVAMGRSRSPDVKVALVLGANEGVFPARPPVEGILSDDDREFLSHLHIVLGPTSLRHVFEEEHMVYTALTRASDRLYVSFAQATDDGAPLLPSSIVRRLKELLPDLVVRQVDSEPLPDQEDLTDWIVHPYSAAGMLSARLRQSMGTTLPRPWQEVYQALSSQAGYSSLMERITSGSRYHNRAEPLSAAAVRRLYGTRLRGSVSRLELFNNCPFAYFVSYGLGLKEREVYKLAAPDIGSFFHDALDMFATRVADLGLDWGNLNDDRCGELAAEVTKQLAPRLQGEILLSNNRNRYIMGRLQNTLRRSASYLGRHLSKGKFRPLAVEITFGGEEGRAPRLSFALSDGSTMELTGRIDRIDGATEDGRLYVRVIDYKSGNAKLTPLEVYHGLKIQLLVYLQAALQMAPAMTGEGCGTVVPAAALYFHVQDPVIQSSGPLSEDDLADEAERRFRPSGYVLAEADAVRLMEEGLQGRSNVIPVRINKQGEVVPDAQAWTRQQYEAMGRHLETLITEAAESIRRGMIAIAPARLDKHTACTYCRFRAVCGFDPGLPGNSYNDLEKISLGDLWDCLGAAGEVPDCE